MGRRVGISGSGMLAPAELGSTAPLGTLPCGLLTNLIAYWPGNEVNGNALDAHVNGLTLSDTNTVTSNPGLVYALSRQYTRNNQERHVRPGDDALLSTGDIDFTQATWCRADSLPGAGNYPGVAGKWGAATGEYVVLYVGDTGRFAFSVQTAGGVTASVTATSLGAPAINVWYLIITSHDSVADTITIQVNNGTIDTTNHAGGVRDGANVYLLGALFHTGGFPGIANSWNGRIGPTMFWKSAAGGGGVLSAFQRT